MSAGHACDGSSDSHGDERGTATLLSRRSEAIVARARRAALRRLFDTLAGGGEGAAASTAALRETLSQLPTEVVAAIEPALHESEQLHQSQFVELVEAALAATPPAGPREFLLRAPREGAAAEASGARVVDADPKSSFTPHVSERSRALAASRRPAGAPLYEALYLEQTELERRRHERAEAVARAQAEECPFRPLLCERPHGEGGEGSRAATVRCRRKNSRDELTREEKELAEHCTFRPYILPAPAHKARSGPLPPGRGGASPPGRPAGRRRSTYACSGSAQGASVVPLEAESHREEPSNWTSVMRDREALQALMQSL